MNNTRTSDPWLVHSYRLLFFFLSFFFSFFSFLFFFFHLFFFCSTARRIGNVLSVLVRAGAPSATVN